MHMLALPHPQRRKALGAVQPPGSVPHLLQPHADVWAVQAMPGHERLNLCERAAPAGPAVSHQRGQHV
jgi:hypothetical protein